MKIMKLIVFSNPTHTKTTRGRKLYDKIVMAKNAYGVFRPNTIIVVSLTQQYTTAKHPTATTSPWLAAAMGVLADKL